MRLSKARVQNYRSIRDTGWFEVEPGKTILVGPNEAGKTAVLQALQQINAPTGIAGFSPLRDYPRSAYNDITTGKVDPTKVTVAEAHFTLEADDNEAVPEGFEDCVYVRGRRLDNTWWHRIDGGLKSVKYGDIKKDITRLCAHIDGRLPASETPPPEKPSAKLDTITKNWSDEVVLDKEHAAPLKKWLDQVLQCVFARNVNTDSHLT